MLSTPWEQRKSSYGIVIIGSGYGGAIAAARLAGANLNPKPSGCILERGKERPPREVSGTLAGGVRRGHRGGAPGGGQSQSQALGLYSGTRQGTPARRVSGDAGGRDRRGAQFGQPPGTF